MNKLQSFIASLPCGFITTREDEAKLLQLDRLCPVLVRCGGCRFTCAIQDLPHLTKAVLAVNDYVRDVSLPVGSMERAASWRSLCPSQDLPRGQVQSSHSPFPAWMHRHASTGHAYDDTITETNIGL